MAAGLLGVAAQSFATPETDCQSGRAIAAGKYTLCAQKAVARSNLVATPHTFDDTVAYNLAAGKCVTKYARAWDRLRARAAGTGATCDNPRFADGGDTVTDRLTGLEWEKKTADASVHDHGNNYAWSAGGAGFTAADGPVFTTFLATLNGGGCFAGQCDWRLPTRDELLTIVSPANPACTSGGPCVDAVFGPTAANLHWTATTYDPFPVWAWSVDFFNGAASPGGKANDYSVRAVRSGL